MKKLIPALALVLLPALAMAQYTGPGSTQQPSVTNAAAATNAADDTLVVLEGKITSQINKDTYWFQDNTGKIRVEIDRKRMPATQINQNTRVRLYGEVDKDFSRPVEIDVKRVEILN